MSMSNLVAVVQRQRWRWEQTGRVLDADRVAGLREPSSPTITEYGYQYRRWGHAREISIGGLSPEVAHNIFEFYKWHQTFGPRELRPFFNCHMFTWIALGKLAVAQPANILVNGSSEEALETQLQPEEAYSVQDQSGELVHSMISTGSPEYSLSVLGERSPMFFATAAALMHFYNGTALRHIVAQSVEYAPPGPNGDIGLMSVVPAES